MYRKINVKGLQGLATNTSKGNQAKWYKGGLWIKSDMQG